VPDLRLLAVALATATVLAPAAAMAQYWGPYGYTPYPPSPYPYPYTYPPGPPSPMPPPASMPGPPPVTTAQQPQFWYRCDDPQGYYPHVTSCPGGWHEEQVPAATTVTPATPPRSR